MPEPSLPASLQVWAQAAAMQQHSPFEQSAEIVDARGVVLRGLLYRRHLTLSRPSGCQQLLEARA